MELPSKPTIAAALKAQGLTDAQIAEKLEVHERTIRKWRLPIGKSRKPLEPIANDLQSMKDCARSLAALALAKLKADDASPSVIANALPKISRALTTLSLIDDPGNSSVSMSIEDMREELTRKLEALRKSPEEGE